MYYEVSGLFPAKLRTRVHIPYRMQRVVHLDKLFQLHEVVQRTRVSHVNRVLPRKKVQLDAQLLYVAPRAARDEVLEEAELGTLRVNHQQVQHCLQTYKATVSQIW